MLIHWIVAGVSVDASGAPLASLATNRYRAILPAKGLAPRGHSIKLFLIQSWAMSDSETTIQIPESPEVVVIGKLLIKKKDAKRGIQLGERIVAKIARMQEYGARVFADVNDDHFDDETSGAYWRSLVKAVDGVVSGSAKMAEIVRIHTNKPVFVVGDPLGAPLGEPLAFRTSKNWQTRLVGFLFPKQVLRSRLRLVWYGNAPNWPSMAQWAGRIADFAEKRPLHIQVICQTGAGIEAFAENFNAQHMPYALMEFVPWHEETIWSHVADAHVVLIPSDLDDSSKSVKTANRLTDALHCGRFVVASPVPAYSEYQDCAWLGEDLTRGICWAVDHPDEVLERIRRGQERVVRNCSVEAIAEAWEAAFMRLPAGERPRAAAASEISPVQVRTVSVSDTASEPVRLNLGCGDKVLEGYVNVDVAPSRRGLRPDVLCDLHDLNVFASDSADEILAVHVVEHFWRWEVLDILREWVRVLKPGGKMILECPNLISACQALLNDPANASAEDARGQRSMWVFYGDPSWQDPLMTHRWAYTPESLASLMRESGLVDIHQEPAQFKLREPRDMRVVGIKPTANGTQG